MAFVDLPIINIHIKQQESIPVGCGLPAFVVLGVYPIPLNNLLPGYPTPNLPYLRIPFPGYPTPPVDRMTDACENITFQQLRWRTEITNTQFHQKRVWLEPAIA